MHSLIERFFDLFENDESGMFNPPEPSRGKSGKDWWVSKKWTDYLEPEWLPGHFYVESKRNTLFRVGEIPVSIPGDKKQRFLDAGLWLRNGPIPSENGTMDYALEWEWDSNNAHKEGSDPSDPGFTDGPFCDFRKVLFVDARCGMAIIQTRVDEKQARKDRERGYIQADDTIKRIRQSYETFRQDDRPVGLIEIRRTFHEVSRVEFRCRFYDLASPDVREGRCLKFPVDPLG